MCLFCEINLLLQEAVLLLIKQRQRQWRWEHAKPELLNESELSYRKLPQWLLKLSPF